MSLSTLAPREHHDARPPQQSAGTWRFPWLQAITGLVMLVGFCVFLYPSTAAWFSQLDQSRIIEISQAELDLPPNNDAQFRADQLGRAHEYNDSLASGALFAAHSRVPVGDGDQPMGEDAYDELLNSSGTGFMGRLSYDSLDIDLPIYHGTSDDTLGTGVGHLEGTSLPVGGIGTRSVLTAHRGLPSARLFTDLNHAKAGDTFTVSVLDQVLTYRVIETRVIEPEDTESIRAQADRDLVTLVTCTPLGLNTQRIIVTGERVTPTPAADIERAQHRPDIPGFPWWAVGALAAVALLSAYVWQAGRPRAARPEPGTAASAKGGIIMDG
ncbi:class C sortase [Leucobacter sp. GX0328]